MDTIKTVDLKHTPEFLIDKDGIWYSDGVRMVQQAIIKLFAEHFVREENGQYAIDWQHHHYPVQVDDVPFLAVSAEQKDGQVLLQLYDGRTVPMPPCDILMKDDVPYVSLFWKQDTRISRTAYFTLSENMVEENGSYVLRYGGQEWHLKNIGGAGKS